MHTTIDIEGADFLINGKRTYEGRHHHGRRIEGLLINSRMIQAIFDDECAETLPRWRYPDTGVWDPDRNTAEFCAQLPEYRRHGLLGVTVGLQGGGSIYDPEVFERYENSAFHPDGSLKEAYMTRLARVLAAADACGMVVFVNYFYWMHERRFESDAAVRRATEAATAWLLASGFRNILVDVKNEVKDKSDLLSAGGVHQLLDIARSTTLDGRRLLISTSVHPHEHKPRGEWHRYCDFLLPHGNDSLAEQWRMELRAFKADPDIAARPRPICCNEDSIDIASFESALDEGVSWGYFDQGYGCGQTQLKHDWQQHGRETEYEKLSGFQTVPVNWSINTPHKRAFFEHTLEVTGGL